MAVETGINRFFKSCVAHLLYDAAGSWKSSLMFVQNILCCLRLSYYYVMVRLPLGYGKITVGLQLGYNYSYAADTLRLAYC